MNVFTYFKQVVFLALFFSFSYSLKSQCGQPDGTIMVITDSDEGAGSLRAAINCANLTAGPNRIVFNIPGNERVLILVGSSSGAPLPNLTDNQTIIDATTQPGFGLNGNFEPQIILDGSVPLWTAPINALKVIGDQTEVYGLEIRNFPDDGIDVDQADDVIIGDIEKGNVIYNCGIDQDFFPDTGNQGPYNGVGIVASSNAENLEIIGNIIGTDYNGNPGLGNEWVGIYIRFGSDFALIENNIITENEVGIRLRNAFGIQISENNLYCNTLAGIQFVDGGNDDKIAPVVNEATGLRISGTGNAGDEIEVFLTDNCAGTPCQGSTFLGRTLVQNDLSWTLEAPYVNNYSFSGTEQVTATATDANSRTSLFSDCQNVRIENNCADANGIIWVRNTNDDGPESLRQAIECANASPGPNTIRFNINGGGRQQINVGATTGSELPFLRDQGTIIDGTTQPGFGAGGNFAPLIVLDGSFHDWTFPHNALWIRADNCEVYGLEIRNFPDDGIDITGGDFNIIGAPNKGNVIYNCGLEKDFFEDSPNTGPWNGCGIVLKNGAQNTVIQSNYIGTDYTQTISTGNELCGIIIQGNGNNNLIGGDSPQTANIIAYNLIGINVRGGAYNNRLPGNRFYCNTNAGIDLSSDANNNQPDPAINIASVSVISGTGNNGDIIEVYAIDSNCLDGPCQGSTLLGITTVENQTWRLTEPFSGGIELQENDQITATATSTSNNTSEFSPCKEIGDTNTPIECEMGLIISNFSNETCVGNDGSFTLSATNASLPVSYDNGNGPSDNPIFSNLSAGVYNIVATDAAGCSVSLSVAITRQSTPTLSVVATTNENCGLFDGSVSLFASGGQGPYIYEMEGGRISRLPAFNNLSAGEYTFHVIDANNCRATETVSIQSIGGIDVTVADMRSDNCSSATGSFRLAPTGGQPPYSYDMGNGPVSSNLFSGLSSGSYSVTVADANNCSIVTNIEVNGSSAPIPAIESVTQTGCDNPSGSVSLSVTGGTAPYRFNIGDGDTNNAFFSDLSAGDYTLTITDANNCTVTQFVRIENPDGPSLSVISAQNASCGNANGAISVLSSGGETPYLYDIGWGITTDPNFHSLSIGTYTITVTDNNGCVDEMSVQITDTPTPTVSVANLQHASCNLDNAIITLEANGEGPFSFDIGNGPVDDPVFSNLSAGAYTITLTDKNACSASISVEVESNGGPQVNIVSTSEARCDNENGSFTISALGGFAPYTYDIGNGPTTNPEFRNLSGGNYVVTLTDGNGCTATQSVTLGNIPAPTFGIGNIIDASCGDANGSFTVSAFGGLPPYQFGIGGNNTSNPVFSELSAGTYTVVVTDANSCSTALGVSVDGTEAPEVSISSVTNAQCGATDGSFSAEASGGKAPYFFDIGAGETTSGSFADLSPGDYILTVTDASGCSRLREVSIERMGAIQPTAAFDLDLNNLEVSLRNNSQEGSSFFWDFGDGNTSDQENPEHIYQESGSYQLCLTASNDCESDTYCQGISVEAVNTDNSFEFDFGEVAGKTGEIIKVPVYVKNFNSIVGFQKSVHLTDTAIARFIRITDIQLKDLSAGLFNLQDFQYSVSWIEGNIEGLNLPDSTIIYQIELEITGSASCADIVLKDAPLPTQVYQKSGNNEIEVDYFKQSGSVCISEDDPGNLYADISGLIRTEQNVPISNVSLSCTDVSTLDNEVDGRYLFPDLPVSKNYTIKPEKNRNLLNGVSTFDLVIIQNHILGNSQITSPYKLIAADVNRSGIVTVSDVLELRRLLLMDLADFTNNTSWRFIPADYQFENPQDPLKENFPESISIDLKDINITADFIGVKIGDVNENALPNQLMKTDSRNNKKNLLTLSLPNQYLVKGQKASITVNINDLQEIAGFQFGLHFNQDKTASIRIGQHGILKEGNISQHLLQKGYLLCSWQQTENLVEGSRKPMVTLDILAKKSGWLNEFVQLDARYLQVEAYDQSGKTGSVQLSFWDPKNKTTSEVELFQNKPNPFREFTVINYQMPEKGRVRFDFFDSHGKQIYLLEETGKKGKNKIFLSRKELPGKGLIYYQLTTPFGQKVKKMLALDE